MTEGPVVATYQRHRRVYVGDDDSSGLIFFPMYYHYIAEAEQDFFDQVGIPAWSELAEGVGSPAVHTSCDYVAPARAGDLLLQELELRLGRRTSFRIDHTFTLAGELVARASSVRVHVDTTTMRPLPLPQWVTELGSQGAAADVV